MAIFQPYVEMPRLSIVMRQRLGVKVVCRENGIEWSGKGARRVDGMITATNWLEEVVKWFRRLRNPEEIAGGVAFTNEPDSENMTGSSILIDGGME